MRVTRFTNLTCAFLVAALIGTNAYAGGRPDSSSRDWFGHINGGYAFATGTTSDFLDDDWTIGGGAIYWPSDWPLGIALDVNYWQMDLSSKSIAIWSLGSDQSDGLYLTGGISWNSVTGQVTDEGLVYYPPVCDPWLWWCIPGGVGPGTFIVGKQSSDEFGWNVGLGYSFPNTDGRGYVELRYESIEFEGESIEYIPLVIGIRWL
jgi:opacity protein-like surface antigen